jgi:hypothetical protein
MYQPASFRRRDTLTKHPPYGLYLDPHRGRHNWTAASKYVLLALLAIAAGLLLALALISH